MLYAKINPAAVYTQNTTPFTAPTTIEADYLTALARPYATGASQINFEVIFGKVVKDENAVIVGFNNVSNISVVLTKEEISTWGLDDEVLLNILANKIGTEITEFVTIDKTDF